MSMSASSFIHHIRRHPAGNLVVCVPNERLEERILQGLLPTERGRIRFTVKHGAGGPSVWLDTEADGEGDEK